jgi:hypothetical protein
VALPTDGAKQVADFFIQEILLRHGAPETWRRARENVF